MSATTNPEPAGALAELFIRMAAVEKAVGDILLIVGATPNPTKAIAGLTERLDGLEGSIARRDAAVAGLRSGLDAVAADVRQRATHGDLAGVRDMVIDTVGVVINEKQRDGRAALAGIASEIATAKAGSPSAQAASVIRAHLRQWAS